jgi:hypothetical protein
LPIVAYDPPLALPVPDVAPLSFLRKKRIASHRQLEIIHNKDTKVAKKRHNLLRISNSRWRKSLRSTTLVNR